MAKVDNEKRKSSYFKEMKQELKKVVWPTPKELVNNTIAVIAFVLCIGIIVFVLDFCFDNINKYGIVKLQEKIQTVVKSDDNIETTEDETTENIEVEPASEDENNVSDETINSEEATEENVDNAETPETNAVEEDTNKQENVESNE